MRRIGGVIGCCYFVIQLVGRVLGVPVSKTAQPQPWSFYLLGALFTLVAAVVLCGGAMLLVRWIYQRLDIRAQD